MTDHPLELLRYRIDPELRRATPIPLGSPLAVVAIGEADRSVWVGALAD